MMPASLVLVSRPPSWRFADTSIPWLLLLAALATNPSAVSAEAFPTKPVYIVVPFAAGGILDSLTRLVAEQLQAKWQQAVIIENRVGASGNVGAAYVGQSEANGHTLLASPPPPLAVNQFLFKSLTFKPSDFAIAAILAKSPNVLVANPNLKASNLPELIALAKASPGKLNYASTGRGGTPHLTMEWLKREAGIDLVHVPYAKGYPQALTDLVGGQVDLMFANLSDAKPLIQSGRLKAIAVADTNPLEEVPGALPISEQIPGFTSADLVRDRGAACNFTHNRGADIERRCRRHEVAICNRASEGSFADACRKLACRGEHLCRGRRATMAQGDRPDWSSARVIKN